MPVKILLADKSITIQKVVEMLFSGKEYSVLCVSDGETALSEAARAVPDVVLADVDLPRIDGYSFSARIRQVPALAQTPVILMMSRDDVYDEAKGRQASIVDHIAKPFESQELIGKVKKAIASAPPRPAEPVPAAPPRAAAAARPEPSPVTPRPAAPQAPQPPKAKQATPSDIFDIIEDAPTQADLRRAAPQTEEEEGVYEVEPVIEIEEDLPREVTSALPVGEKAVEEMRAGLGLSDTSPGDQDIISFESLDMATKTAKEYIPPQRNAPGRPERIPEREAREYVPPQEREAREYVSSQAKSPEPVALSEERLRGIAEEVVTRMASAYLKNLPPPQAPRVSEESVRRAVEESVGRIVADVARDVIEKVAWEVVPDLAEMLIKAEIERLKAEQ